jgi:hypothetical protein
VHETAASSVPATPKTGHTTPAQDALYRLASASAAAPRAQGRYVVMSEKATGYLRTSVIDSRTGDTWTYQEGAGVPAELPVAKGGSPTLAQLGAMPTDPTDLRATLISQARSRQATGQRAMTRQIESAIAHVKGGQGDAQATELRHALRSKLALVRSQSVPETDDDLVFSQATDLLWNPLVPPSLRSAIYRVLASTPGVAVDSHARDSTGRPAIEISRFDPQAKTVYATYENPTDGAVLESAFTSETGTQLSTTSDLYESLSWTNAVPSNPYGS